jgi:hypothetical protein
MGVYLAAAREGDVIEMGRKIDKIGHRRPHKRMNEG